MDQKVIRTGNSLAVTIPANFVKDMGIIPGNPVKVLTEVEKGRIIYNFQGVKQLPLLENMPRRKKIK
jgi:antitoxin component of MazEF toxin-antitoxin module